MQEKEDFKYKAKNELFEDYDSIVHHDDANEYWGMDVDKYCTFMHLSQFAGTIVPMAGYILPLVMWLMYREESPVIDKHGKNIVNWMISVILYFVVSIILIFVLIGIPLLLGLVIISIVFPIIGAVKASEGKFYTYPWAIKFIK